MSRMKNMFVELKSKVIDKKFKLIVIDVVRFVGVLFGIVLNIFNVMIFVEFEIRVCVEDVVRCLGYVFNFRVCCFRMRRVDIIVIILGMLLVVFGGLVKLGFILEIVVFVV